LKKINTNDRKKVVQDDCRIRHIQKTLPGHVKRETDLLNKVETEITKKRNKDYKKKIENL